MEELLVMTMLNTVVQQEDLSHDDRVILLSHSTVVDDHHRFLNIEVHAHDAL